MNENDSLTVKKERKKQMITQIVNAMDTLSLSLTKKPSERFKEKLPNNAYFMNFRQYQAKQNDFWEEYSQRFHGDLKSFIQLS